MTFTEAEFLDVLSGIVAPLNACTRLATEYSAVAHALPDRSKYPHSTLLRLELVGRIHFNSGVMLLQSPWLSYGVDSHLRPLLEVYAHAGYIMSSYRSLPGSTHRGRALCIELQTYEHEYAEAHRHHHPEYAAHIKALVDFIRTAHDEEPCTCGGRGHQAPIERELREMAKAGAPGWLPAVWSRASRALHVSRLEHMQRFGEAGSTYDGATFTQRAVSFRILIELYAAIVAWTLLNHNQATAKSIMFDFGTLLTRQPIVESLQGEWDPTL